ncbi:MAG: ABC transporter permease [Cytophagaceae bacterium]
MNKSLVQLVSLQFKIFFREPAIIFWAVIFPILMAWVLGVAFSNKGEMKKTVAVAGTISEKSVAWLKPDSANTVTKLFGEEIKNPVRMKFVFTDEPGALLMMKRGQINLFLQQHADTIIYRYDPTNPEAVNTYLMIEREINRPAEVQVKSAISPITSKGNRYIDFLIPGLIAMGIMNSCLWGISWNLIEFRMKKLLRRMVATPMSKTHFLLSNLITRTLIGAFETGVLLLFAFLYFSISLEGSIAALLMIYFAGIMAFAGIAIMISSRTASSQIGNGLINAVTLPMMILSGIFFSYHNFPDWCIPFIKYLPLTLLADSIRSIFVEGAGIGEILVPVMVLAITGIVTFFAGLKLYRWY